MAKNIKGRKFVATAASAALVASAIVPVASAAEFADQSKISSWAADAVAHAVEKGYMQGKDGNKFDPKATITKAEVATVIFNALGLEKATTGTFKDVPASAWYAGAVNALQAEGIVEGSEGKFEPTKDVTLIEAAQMVAKALKIEGTADLSKFADASKVPAWANASIQAMVANGYIEGGEVNGKLSLDPLSKLTRERLATMFVKVAKAELEGGSEETPKPTPTPDAATITTVTAVKANVIEVKFGGAVDTEKTTLKLTKGTAAVSATVAWNEAKTVATFTTTAKLTKGDYTVTLADADGKALSTGKTSVVDQHVAEIKILNNTALTGTSPDTAYIYYDVVDQYGESLRATTSIQWSGSVSKIEDDKRKGRLKVTKSGSQFMYGEKVYITGVYAKTGVSVTKTLEIGAQQALNGVTVAGFVKKGTNQILSALPKGFKSGEYYMVYNVTDQNGNLFDADKPVTDNHVTFITDNVLVVKELSKTGETKLTIAGEDYHAVIVEPGINVSRGGDVTITAIANRTGNKTEFKTKVTEEQILTSFTLSTPSTLVTDGQQGVEIPFEALDQNGEKITNFVTLAKQATFNTLSLQASEGTLQLVEQNDGSAKLIFNDKSVDWKDGTDGIDRPISLTSVVVGGNSSNQMLYIQDKARPVAIAAVDMDNVLVEGNSDKITLSNFDFLDQYGRNMTTLQLKGEKDNNSNKNRGQIYDNGFFSTVNESSLNGQDFTGYNFFVRATYKGDTGVVTGFTPVENDLIDVIDINDDLVISAVEKKELVTAKTGLSVRYEIVKEKIQNNNVVDSQAISPVKNEELTVVDIAAVKDLKVTALPKQYVNTAFTNAPTGREAGLANQNLTTTLDTASPLAAIAVTHEDDVVVTGTYNGETVYIPAKTASGFDYYTATGQKLNISNIGTLAIKASDFRLADFYDVTSANYLRKDADALLKLTIHGVIASGDTANVDTVTTAVKLSDAAPTVAKLNNAPEELVLKPTKTELAAFSYDATTGEVNIAGYKYQLLDQYGKAIKPADNKVSIKVASVVENKDGYTENNFSVSKNDSTNVTVSGAERGDTFVLTITAENVTTTIKVTVGADSESKIVGSKNNYLESVVNTLETQKK